MAEAKTRPTQEAVEAFLGKVEPEWKRQQSFELLEMFKEITGDPAEMWGTSIVGFGRYTQTYANGKKANWLATGFSPRKASFSIYIMDHFDDHQLNLQKLGKHKIGKACLYVNKLEDVDQDVLKQMIRESVEYVKETYPLDPSVKD
jgi:hypothetical protein